MVGLAGFQLWKHVWNQWRYEIDRQSALDLHLSSAKIYRIINPTKTILELLQSTDYLLDFKVKDVSHFHHENNKCQPHYFLCVSPT